MNTIVQRITLFLFVVVVAIFSWNCQKEEEAFVPDPFNPDVKITLEKGPVYDYGDTIPVSISITETAKQNLRKTLVYLNNQIIYSTDSVIGEYGVDTDNLSIGKHNLKVVVSDNNMQSDSDSVVFTIIPVSSVVQTIEVVNVGTDSATVRARVVFDGGQQGTMGLCYNTSGNPERGEGDQSTTDTLYAFKLTGLTKLTSYYVRTWIVNDAGLSYGEEIEFKTTDESGTFVDFRDDHEYSWVKIGEQVWMAENLAYLPFLSDPNQKSEKDSNIYVYEFWGIDINEAYKSENYKHYGALYTWKMAKKYCPSGWHLPDTTEWNELITFLGGIEVAGGKMKNRGTEFWKEPNTEATNESGFNSKGVGSYTPRYFFSELGDNDSYWSSSELHGETLNGEYQLSYKDGEFELSGIGAKASGLPVRCIKD